MAAGRCKHVAEAGQEIGKYGTVVIDPEIRVPGPGGRLTRKAVLKCGLCGNSYEAPVDRVMRGHHQVCPECARHLPRPGAQKLKVLAGQRLGDAVILDPEVRQPRPSGAMVRYVKLRCVCEKRHASHDGRCGVTYLAPLVQLTRGWGRCCGNCSADYRRSMSRQGRVHRNQGGYVVTLHVGWYKSRAEAEAMAARARIALLPEDRARDRQS